MDGFRKFLLRGNVVDLAVAVVIGAAFGAIIDAFVKAFVTPLVGLVTGSAGDFSQKVGHVSKTAFPYGLFVQALLSFVIIAAVVYFVVVIPIQRLMDRYKTQPEPSAPVVACTECLSKIPVGARRCMYCTSEQLAG
ncbi:MAG: large conductance mechanosensitive channel protein MscL [Actinomycetota bacterium]